MFSSVSVASSSVVPRIVFPSRCGVSPETNRNTSRWGRTTRPGFVPVTALFTSVYSLH